MFDASGTRVGAANLSVPRGTIAATSWGDLAFFAGGQDEHKVNTDAFEIFNVTSRCGLHPPCSQSTPPLHRLVARNPRPLWWSQCLAHSVSGHHRACSRAVMHTHVFSTMVVERLSQARAMASATTVGHYVLIAGGELTEKVRTCKKNKKNKKKPGTITMLPGPRRPHTPVDFKLPASDGLFEPGV